jgi:hypothetical protein
MTLPKIFMENNKIKIVDSITLSVKDDRGTEFNLFCLTS